MNATLKRAARAPLSVFGDKATLSLLLAFVLVCSGVAGPAASMSGVRAQDVLPTQPGGVPPAGQPSDTVVVYGPRRFDRAAAPMSKFIERFTLPEGVGAPFNIHVQNGLSPDVVREEGLPQDMGRVPFADIRINHASVFEPGEIGLNAETPPRREITLVSSNTLEVSMVGRADAFLSITITATRLPAPPPVINDFNPRRGPAGTIVTLSGSALAPHAEPPAVTFAGSGGHRLPALVHFAGLSEVRVSVPNGAQSGPIVLETRGGSASTAEPFTVGTTQDFGLTVAPSAAPAVQGGTATYVVHLNSLQSSFTQVARLSASDLPAGTLVAFEPEHITSGATSSLHVRLPGTGLAPGSYSFNISATASIDNQDVVRTSAATLNVIAAGQTTLTGRVLSTDREPIIGATASLDGQSATTDAAGVFILSGVTAGSERPLMVDGRTASAPNRTYPVILEPAAVVAGEANTVPYIFYLPPIDVEAEVELVPGQGAVASNPRVPNLTMTVPADANLRNRDGSPVARVSITPLDIDRTPAPLPPDVTTALVYTSQPGGAVASVAMPVVYPNLIGADPGTRVDLYAFNHDTVRWYVYGFGRVSADGRTIAPETNPSTGRPYGLPDFSWHFPSIGRERDPGPPPTLDFTFGGDGGKDGRNEDEGEEDDCPSTRTSNTVDLTTGIKIEETTDISIGGARGGLRLSRVYTSDLAQVCSTCPFGRGTSHNYAVRLSGTWAVGGAGRVRMPEEGGGRLFNYARTDADGALVFSSTATINQLDDVVRKLTDGTFEYRTGGGKVLRFNASGRLTALVDRNGNTTTLTYTGANLTQVTDAVGRSLTLEYSAGRIIKATDPTGRVWEYDYGSVGALTRVTDPLGQETRYQYTSVGARLTSVTDRRGNVVKRITYDAVGRVTSQQFADGGVESYAYTLSGNVVTSVAVTDPLGRVETKRFSAAGYIIGITDALGQESRTVRAIGTNLPLSSTGPCGCTEDTRQFDARGNVTAVTDRLGQTTSFEYEPLFNRVTKMTDKLGRVTLYAYDARGNLISATDALNRTTSFTYDGFGQLTGVTDALNHTTVMEYDARGHLSAVTNALGHRSAFEYDLLGRLTNAADPLGRSSVFEYDVRDRLVSATDAAGATTRFEYDANGNLTRLTDGLGRDWLTSFDDKNRAETVTDPLGHVRRLVYNAADELTFTISPSRRRVAYAYDRRGQLTTVTDETGGVSRFAYDAYGQLTTVADPRGHTVSYTYDELHRPSLKRDPLGQVSTAAYDAVGNPVRLTDRLGRQTELVYDALDRISRAAYADATVAYAYDAAGRPTRIDDTQSGFIEWAYDDANRLLHETTPQGIVAYDYNAAGQRTSLAVADRQPVAYDYDAAGRLHTITQGPEVFTYAHDALSRPTSLNRPNGVNTTYAYDAAGRLLRLRHANAAGQPVEDFRYGYNEDDEITNVSSLLNSSPLPQAKNAATADAANRVPQFGPAAYTFNAEGQTTSKADAQGTATYLWDARGRLTRVTHTNAPPVSYTYDALGRRTARTESAATTDFLYDGDDVALDRASGGTTVDYLNGISIDDKLRQTNSSGGDSYFLQDHINSTVALTDAAGHVSESLTYEAFGGGLNNGITRYGYTGREHDSVTGLLYYRARWYDSHQGRFISEDPLGFGSGLNFYSYVEGNPISLIDPLGLDACYVLFPDYPITYLGKLTTKNLGGHAGVLGYDESTGSTRYYEYGRYGNKNGVVKRRSIPNLKIGADGQPVPASLDALKKTLSEKYGKNTPATLKCQKVDEQKVFDYAEQYKNDSNRPPYSWNPLKPNHCRSFATDAINAGRN